MVYIIAEVGVNHNGSVDIAKELVDLAKKAGADAVKFQTFKTNKLVRKGTSKAAYQKKNENSGTQDEMLKKYELTYEQFRDIKLYCDNIGIEFISTPFDRESAELLNSLNVDYFKIGSGDLNNYPLLRTVANFNKNIILSTGMSNLKEVEDAVEFIQSMGFLKELNLLHCVSCYPTQSEDVNMRCLKSLYDIERVDEIGFSDHTHGHLASVIAIAQGATIIEKHFTLSKNMEGPDHTASLDGPELIDFINKLRETEIILGTNIKKCQINEIEVRNVARRSLAFARDMKAGEKIGWDDLIGLRPNDGIATNFLQEYIGKELICDVKENEFLARNVLCLN
jgi:N,N'-diacetyllegionaminate synthase